MKKYSHFIAALLVCASASAAPLKAKPNQPKNRVITLEQAYDMTLASDQSIRIAFYESRKANLLPWSALAKLGPQLIGNASYTNARSNTRNNIVETPATPNYIQTTINTQFSGFTYTQPLFDPSVFPAYRYGKLSAKAARLQYQFTVRQTLFGVAQAYYDVLKGQKLVDVNQQTVNLANEQLNTAQARFDAGAVARIDVLRARSTLEGARNTLIQFQGRLDTARDTLSIDQQIALRGEVVAQYGPKIVAQASTQWSRNTGDADGRQHDESAVIAVTMPFLTGGQREIDLINANQNISESRLNLEKTTKSIESEVKVAWVNVQTGREALKALTADVEASTQNYTDLEAQYQAGASTSLDAQTALRDLNNSRTLLTNQVYDYQIALRDLKRAEAEFQKERVEKSKLK